MKQITTASKILSVILLIACIGFTACQKDMSGGQNRVTTGSSANAAAVTRSVTKIPALGMSFPVPIDCINGGLGEVLMLQGGTLMITSQVTISGNNYNSTVQIIPMGITAIGATTGDLYHGVGGEQFHMTGSLINGQSRDQIVDMFYWIGQGGDAAKFKFNIRYNLVTNADGTVTASIDEIYSTCQ